MTHYLKKQGGWKTRIIVSAVYIVALVTTIIFSGLAEAGRPPFNNATGDISGMFDTCVTPAGYTFLIRLLIYLCFVCLAVYTVVALFKTIDFDKIYKIGGALPVSYLVTLSINLALTTSWLFVWDAQLIVGSSVLLIIIMIINIFATFLMCYSFFDAAPKLLNESRLHFWINISLINAMSIYCLWTVLVAILNFAIFLIYTVKMDMCNVCTGVHIFTLTIFIGWFVLETAIMDKILNPLVTHYLVYLWASIGIYGSNKSACNDTLMYLALSNIIISFVLAIARGLVIYWRNGWNKKEFYIDESFR